MSKEILWRGSQRFHDEFAIAAGLPAGAAETGFALTVTLSPISGRSGMPMTRLPESLVPGKVTPTTSVNRPRW